MLTLCLKLSLSALFRLTTVGLRTNIFKILFGLILVASTSVYGASGDVIEFRADSPQLYQVVRGDTLWDISGRFLEEPWLWPEVWQSNPQIENPDLIYPGDYIELISVEGVPMLTLRRGEESRGLIEARELRVVRLSPSVSREPLLSPISAIDLSDIDNFLSRNRIISARAMDQAPGLVGTENGQRFSRNGDIVYAVGSWNSAVDVYDIVRSGREIKDLIAGRETGIEGIVIGSATMISRDGEQATLVIDKSVEEVDLGDKLLPKVTASFESTFFPQPPLFQVSGNVIDINFGRTRGGTDDTVILDVGGRNRMKVGYLLTLQKNENMIKDGRKKLTFSGEKYGTVLIYQVFEDYSLAIVLNSSLPVESGDILITP